MEDIQTEARFSLPLPLVPFLGRARPVAQPATAQDSAQTSPPLWRGPGLLLPELAAPLQAGHSYSFPSTYGVGSCNTGPSPRVPRGVMSIFVSLQHLVSCPAQTVQTVLRVLAVPLTALPVPGLRPLPSSPQMIDPAPCQLLYGQFLQDHQAG